MKITTTDKSSSPAKKKRVSKKQKSSWRKHVDTTDVDNFLEEQRLEERLGDYGQLADNELFTVDTKTKPAQLSTKQARREKLRNKPLKCLALLQPHTKVPDPITKRNRVRTKEERTNMLIKKKEALMKSQGIFKKRDLQRVKDIKLAKQRRAVERDGKFNINRDIWGDDSIDLIPKTKTAAEIQSTVQNDEWIQGDVERHVIHGPGKMPRTIPKATHKKPHHLKAIELPHPGMSYNPSHGDHQDLLRLVVEKEQKIIKEEKHLQRVTKAMFSKVTPTQRDENWLVEMSEGLKPDQSNVDVNESEEYKPINPPVKNKEKSHQQRRKQKEQQQLREKLRQAKIEKKKISDMYRLKDIHKEIERTQKKVLVLHEKRQKKAEYQKFEAKRLGANKFEEPDLDFNMSKNIAGNLRNLHKEGNLLTDRFKSLQKRNIIVPSVVRSSKSKAKVKRFDKPGHKEDTWKRGIAKKLS